MRMRNLFFAVLVCSGFVLAQDSNDMSPVKKDSEGPVTVTGCVSRASGDYTLMKQDPAETYELQATNKIKLRHYLGQRVEVTGTKAPTMSSSSDAMNKTGSAAPVTITITAIRTLDKECSERSASR